MRGKPERILSLRNISLNTLPNTLLRVIRDKSRETAGFIFLISFALIWIVVTLATFWSSFSEIAAQFDEARALILTVIFPIIGAGMVYLAYTCYRRW